MDDKTLNKIYDACINAMSTNGELSKVDAITFAISFFGFKVKEEQEVFETLINKLTVFFDTKQENSHVLDDQEMKPWMHTVDNDKYYSERYYNFLQHEEQLPARVIDVIKRTNEDILERLGNPEIDIPFKRQGLVVGNVQSGKTANYLSLINLAADYGYKLIILITGIHNNLRSQTQKRVNKGFIGYDSDEQKYVGVGITNDKKLLEVIMALFNEYN